MNVGLVFMIFFCLILVSIAIFMPKKIKRAELYATSAFAVALGLSVDSILALKYKFYTLLGEGVQWGPLFGQIILYASANMIILNYFPYHRSLLRKIIFIIVITAITVIFELLSKITGFIRYNEWNIWYSSLLYPFLILLLVWNMNIFRMLVRKDK